jgi:thymidylate kinase
MQIELIGCTSAGKTTLAKKMLQAGRELGIDMQLSDDFVLKQIRLNWIKNEFIRLRIIELLCLPICVVFWRKYRRFYRLAIRASMKAPGSWFYKLNLARIALRKIGIYEILRRRSSEQQVLLLDNEGVLQASHTLFVHSGARLNTRDLSSFVNVAPLPDVVAYLWQSQAVLFERTLARGHNRLPERSHAKVKFFINQAVAMFDELQQHPALAGRLVIINGERNTVVPHEPHNDSRLAIASKIIGASLNGAAVDHALAERRNGEAHAGHAGRPLQQQTAPEAGLVDRLVESFNRRGVEYCHWKSNLSLAQAMSGEQDLDLFVDPKSLPKATMILMELGFKSAVARWGPNTPGIFHYFGLDLQNGKIIHVHLFRSILTGESFVKGHLFPFEGMLLENRSNIGEIKVAAKAAELVVFVLRTFIKYGSLLDLLHLLGKSGALRKELRWLQADDDMAASILLLKKYCPVVDERLFRQCILMLERESSLAARMILARKVRRRLRVYAKYTPLRRFLAYVPVLWVKGQRRFTGNRKNKVLQSGGATIAFVGADATGKSTLVNETGRWLGKIFAVRTVHVGKPPSSWLTAPVNLALRLARRLFPQMHRRREETPGGSTRPSISQPQASLISYAIKAWRWHGIDATWPSKPGVGPPMVKLLFVIAIPPR